MPVAAPRSTHHTPRRRHAQRHADAFGNTLEDWETGLWTASSGWGHNTKEHNAATGLVYMYQRHYLPETGTFLSTAPFPPMMEHEYTFGVGNPVVYVDPDGRLMWGMPGRDRKPVNRKPLLAPLGLPVYSELCSVMVYFKYEQEVVNSGGVVGHTDKQLHCMMSCIMSLHCGILGASLAGEVGEILDFFFTKEGYSPQDMESNRKGVFHGMFACDNADCITRCKGANLPPRGRDPNAYSIFDYFSFDGKKPSEGIICFLEGTSVWTRDGLVAIEKVEIGDLVYSWDGERRSLSKVTATHAGKVAKVIAIHMADEETIICSPEHALWVSGKGWLRAGDVTLNCNLVTADHEIRPLKRIEKLNGTFNVYNISVQNTANYFVGVSGFLVKNK